MSNSGTSNELAELRTIAALAGRIHLSTLPAEIADPLRAALVRWRRLAAPVGTSAVDPDDCLYFGAWPGNGAGHYLYAVGRGLAGGEVPGLGRIPLDGKWQPYSCYADRNGYLADKYQTQGACRLSHAYGWTFVGWWDRTGDGRFGSNSVLLVPARVDFDEAVRLGRLAFPRVFERLDRAGVALTLEELARTWRQC